MTVFDPRGARGFAGTTGQAAIEVLQHFCVRGFAFEKLLHLVDSAARTIELVAAQLVGRAGRVTKTAMYALAQDRLYRLGMTALLKFWREIGLHASALSTL